MTKDDGGPAFPCKLENTSEHEITGYMGEALPKHTNSVYGGMTLRDYFATHATEADIVHFIMKGHLEDHIAVNSFGAKSIHEIQAKFTRQEAKFKYADAMIEARGK